MTLKLDVELVIPQSNEEIKSRIVDLQRQIITRQSEIAVLGQAILHYRKFCKHEGQTKGSNERDGSWANPCPTCGYSY